VSKTPPAHDPAAQPTPLNGFIESGFKKGEGGTASRGQRPPRYPDGHHSEKENKAIVAEVDELHKTELYLPGVHMTGSAAKDGTGGLSQLSALIEQGHERDAKQQPLKQQEQKQKQLVKQQKQLVEQQLVTNRVIEAISSGKDRTQTADALGFTANQLEYHFKLETKAGRAGWMFLKKKHSL
jgi:hypothetical protein